MIALISFRGREMGGEHGPGRSSSFGHLNDNERENGPVAPPPAQDTNRLGEIADQAEPPVPGAVELDAGSFALQNYIAAFQNREGKKITSRVELDSFRLVQIAPHTHVYILQGQPEISGWLCPDCFTDGYAVALRNDPVSEEAVLRPTCPRCNFIIWSGDPDRA